MRSEFSANLALQRVTPAWQRPAPVRAAKPTRSTLARIVRAIFGV